MRSSNTLYLSPAVQAAQVDQNTTLCLACSSSLPPQKSKPPSSPGIIDPDIFLTRCCRRPICPKCISANPRLQRYDPCLACLGGVSLVRSGSSAPSPTQQPQEETLMVNLDGAVRDNDMFVLGDDDEEEEALPNERLEGLLAQRVPSPPALSVPHEDPSEPNDTEDNSKLPTEQTTDATDPASSKYYIGRNDTLRGIALRYGLNGHELCRLNNLPPSTLHTTPHLLHTRQFLILPPSAHKLQSNENTKEVREREARIARERAEKRLQMLTKEVDWRVAKAYVALAGDTGEPEEFDRKHKEEGKRVGQSSLEERAIERYLDDDEWEEKQKREGAKVGITSFPFVGGSGEDKKIRDRSGWWRWE